MLPGEIELKPAQTVACTGRMGMVIVVPALTEGEQCHPPAIAREIGAIEVAIAEGMGGGIHQPGDVIHDHQAQRDGPIVYDAANFSYDPKHHDPRGRLFYFGLKLLR